MTKALLLADLILVIIMLIITLLFVISINHLSEFYKFLIPDSKDYIIIPRAYKDLMVKITDYIVGSNKNFVSGLSIRRS